MNLVYQVGGQRTELEVEQDGDALRVRLPGGSERRIQVCRLPGGVIQVAVLDAAPPRVFRVPTARVRGSVQLSWEGQSWTFEPARPAASVRARDSGSGAVLAPLAGVVAAVLSAPGASVESGEALLVIETMKTMTQVTAPVAGVVRALHVQVGQHVTHGEALAEVAPAEEGASGV